MSKAFYPLVRLAPGGAQEYFGVESDMVCYGKTLGGGLPCGVICGSKRLMNTSSNRSALSKALVIGDDLPPIRQQFLAARVSVCMGSGWTLTSACSVQGLSRAHRW